MCIVFKADNSWKRRKLILSPKKDTKSITPESMTQTSGWILTWGGTSGILREWGLDAGSHVAFGAAPASAGRACYCPGRKAGRRGAGLEAPAQPRGGGRRWPWRWELLSPLGPGWAGVLGT